jgi:hypothetical protein
MACGFYNHERSAKFKHTAWGSVFGQFLTYWPSKVRYYFGKESKSKYGRYEQKFTLDENGEKQMIWLKDSYDEDGNMVGVEETYENTGIPANHFMGSPFEGLFYSFGLTVRDMVTGNLDKTPKERKRRAMLMIHDMLIGMLLVALVRVFMEDFKDKQDEAYVNQAVALTSKAFYKAMLEFDPFRSVFGAFQWEPAFASMSSNVLKAFMDVFTEGPGKLPAMFQDNWRMLEVLPDISLESTTVR